MIPDLLRERGPPTSTTLAVICIIGATGIHKSVFNDSADAGRPAGARASRARRGQRTGDDGDGYAGGDQAVFDCRSAGLVCQEGFEDFGHDAE